MIRIGADPEFQLIKRTPSGLIKIPASEYFHSTCGGLGIDGYSATGELRPTRGWPADIRYFTRELFRRANEKLPENIEIRAGGGSFFNTSLGGHIHFSGITPTRELIKILDAYIGAPLKRKIGGKRGSSSYGRLGETRYQSHKGIGGFEYRTPPSWLTSPEITYSTMAIAYMIAKKYARGEVIPENPIKQNYKNLMKGHPKGEKIALDFYNAKSIDWGDCLENWGMREKKQRFILSSDSYLDFSTPIEAKKYLPSTVLIYGLRPSREEDLWISGISLNTPARKYLKTLGLKVKKAPRGISIGFSYELRKDRAAERILKDLWSLL